MGFEEDFFGPDPSDYEADIYERELNWKKGKHTTRDGLTIKIKDMSLSHLKNSINYFKEDHDISALEKELNRRSKLKSKK